MVRVVIVEDSALARLELKSLLESWPQLQIVAEADNVDLAVDKIETLQPDLVFMDIDLPGGTAFNVLENLTLVPPLIFTTAFDEHALKAFNFDTVDYLLKPIKKSRLEESLEKFSRRIPDNMESPPLNLDSRIMVKENDECWLIRVGDIRRVESIGNYCRLHCDEKSPMVYRSLTKLAERLEHTGFVRVNRGELLNIRNITRMTTLESGCLMFELDDGSTVEGSRRQTAKVKQLLNI